MAAQQQRLTGQAQVVDVLQGIGVSPDFDGGGRIGRCGWCGLEFAK